MSCPPRTVTLVFTILGVIAGVGTILKSLVAFFQPIPVVLTLIQLVAGILTFGLAYFGYNAITNDRADRVKLYAQIHRILNIILVVIMIIGFLIFIGFLISAQAKDIGIIIVVIIFYIAFCGIHVALNLWHIRSAFATAELISQKQTSPVYSNLHV